MMTPSWLRRPLLALALLVLAGCASVAPIPPQKPDPQPEPAVDTESGSAIAPAVTAAPRATENASPIADGASPSSAAEASAPEASSDEDPALGEPLTRFRLDPLEDAARGDLWERVRASYAMPDLDNELVRKWEQYYAERPDYVQRMTARGSRYLWHIVEEIRRRRMPGDLALLPFIESAFNPQALSVARAAGMWQFMPGTGRDFELKQNLFRDDRRDILASTRAALDYLQMLHDSFGDWHLALAAYNWGQGNVQRAQARNAKAGLPADYENLRMPEETRNYVPKLQAIKNIVARPQDFGIALPPLEDHPYFTPVAIDRDIDLALASQLSGLTLEQFQQLNPQHNKPVILAAGTPQVLLPYDNANRFLRNLRSYRGNLASWTAWVAPRTVKPAEAARMTGMTEAELRRVNHIPPRMLVKAGSTLLVPRGTQHADVSETVAESAKIALAPEAPPLRTRRVKVQGRKPVTVAALARRHGMTPAMLASINGVAINSSFKPGQLVSVALPARSVKTARASRKPAAAVKRTAARNTKRVTTKTARNATKKTKPSAAQTRVAAAR